MNKRVRPCFNKINKLIDTKPLFYKLCIFTFFNLNIQNLKQGPTLYNYNRRGDRAAECTGFENRRGETHRGFESHPLRQSRKVAVSAPLAHGSGAWAANNLPLFWHMPKRQKEPVELILNHFIQ